MNKIICAVLSFLIVFCLASCGMAKEQVLLSNESDAVSPEDTLKTTFPTDIEGLESAAIENTSPNKSGCSTTSDHTPVSSRTSAKVVGAVKETIVVTEGKRGEAGTTKRGETGTTKSSETGTTKRRETTTRTEKRETTMAMHITRAASFVTIEEWLAYEYPDPGANFGPDDFSLITKDKKCIVPVLPEKYGVYQIFCQSGGSVTFKYRSHQKAFGDGNRAIGVSIRHGDFDPWAGKTLEQIADEFFSGFNNFKSFYIEKSEKRFACGYWEGISAGTGENAAFSYIITLHENKYPVFINYSFADEEVMMDIVNNIQIKTLIVK